VLELEQKLLRSQMNPHFIFNALGAIQSFIQKNEKDEATSYLSKFSRLIRLILENSRLNYVSLAKELKSLQDYLQLQQLLFDNKFDYNIDVDEKIDIENINIPPMLAQPFIENALKHGLANSDKKGMLNISFKLKDNLILFDVVDNGVGLQKALELKPMVDGPHQSLATEITKERLNNMNKKIGGKKINIIVQELTGKMNEIIGTKVTFEIPFEYSV
jgi:LytS/YehU family sensor histidine kinase